MRSTQDRTNCIAPANTIVKYRGLGGPLGPLICWYVLLLLKTKERERDKSDVNVFLYRPGPEESVKPYGSGFNQNKYSKDSFFFFFIASTS